MNEVLKIDVTIDVCPNCMGIWLDKGELEKIIEKARYMDSENASYYDQERLHRHHGDDDHDYDDHDDRNKYGNEKYGNLRRKRGGISELFGNLFD